jgi:hypothetical protein
MTLVLNGTDNSTTAPAVQGGTGGTTTGLYYPANNQVSIATNGTQALLVDSNQNIGIGTASPTNKLDIVGGSDILRLTNTSASGYEAINMVVGTQTARIVLTGQSFGDANYGTGDITIQAQTAGKGIRFATNGTTGQMILDSSGNLGIGTSSPGYKLVVKQSSDNLQFAMQGAVKNWNFRNQADGTFGYFDDSLGYWRYYYDASNNHIWFNGASVERMRIDSSGNVGIGTTSPSGKLDVRGDVYLGSNSAGNATYVRTTANWNYSGLLAVRNSSNASTTKGIEFLYDGDATGNTTIGGTNAIWSFANASPTTGSTTSGLQSGLTYGAYYGHRWNVNGTESMRIDSSGNVGIGTTSPDSLLHLQSASNFYIHLLKTGSNDGYVRNIGTMDIAAASGGGGGQCITFSTGANYAGLTERARIDGSGNVLIGPTSSGGIGYSFTGSTGAPNFVINKNYNGGSDAITFRYNGTNIGTISSTTTNTAYNTSSDYRLKENIAPMTGALAKVAALKPVTYKWKSDGSDGEGFVAHELAEICPHAVTGEKDAVDEEGNPKYQGIDVSFLVATLTAAIQEQQGLIQEQQALIASLTGRILALETK